MIENFSFSSKKIWDLRVNQSNIGYQSKSFLKGNEKSWKNQTSIYVFWNLHFLFILSHALSTNHNGTRLYHAFVTDVEFIIECWCSLLLAVVNNLIQSKWACLYRQFLCQQQKHSFLCYLYIYLPAKGRIIQKFWKRILQEIETIDYHVFIRRKIIFSFSILR